MARSHDAELLEFALSAAAGGGVALRPLEASPSGAPLLQDLPRTVATWLAVIRTLIRPPSGDGIGALENRAPRFLDRAGTSDATDAPVAEADEAAAYAQADLADVSAVLGGDGDAFARIVERHQTAIAKSMHRFTRDRVTYEELVQDVFVEAFRSLGTFRGTAPLRHWLRRIAIRVGYRHWRDKARRREATLADDELFGRLEALGNETADHEAGEVVHHLLARLRPRDRLVLTLMYLEGLSVAEIAEATSWSKAMVKVQAHRARKRMRALSEDPRS